ncbi:MAG: hypothetical protein AAF799_43280 [Myxococcota bacterium]
MATHVIHGLKFRRAKSDAAGATSQEEEEPTDTSESGDGVMQPRVREETAPREHVFLHQTVPPVDPVVREVERRRSGRRDTEFTD